MFTVQRAFYYIDAKDQEKHVELVEYFLQHHTIIDITALYQGKTVLHQAYQKGCTEIVKILVYFAMKNNRHDFLNMAKDLDLTPLYFVKAYCKKKIDLANIALLLLLMIFYLFCLMMNQFDAHNLKF